MHMKISKIFRIPKLVILGLAVPGMMTAFSSNALAASAGCTQWNYTGPSAGVSGSNMPFEAGEKATVVLNETNGNSPSYTFTYTDIANGNTVITRSGTLDPNGTVTEDITIPVDTASGRLSVSMTATLVTHLSCAEAPPPAPGSGNTDATTSPSVVSAASRAQTSLISKNIGARFSAIGGTGNRGNRSVGNGGFGSRGSDEVDASFAYSPAYRRDAGMVGEDRAMRRFAMMGSFDSSTGWGMNMPGLGQADLDGSAAVAGRSAFDTASPVTVWGHGTYISVDNDYVNGGQDNRYNGDVWGYSAGLDYKFSSTLTAGLSLAYHDTDLTTSFNDGSYREKGWIVSPYAIYRPFDGLTVSGHAGFGMGDIDVRRDNNAVSGETDSNLWYAQLDTAYKIRPAENSPLSFTSSLGFTTARKTVDGYVESDSTVVSGTTVNTRQIRPAIEAAYDFFPGNGSMITPFIETALVYDFTDAINNDKTAFEIGGGVRLFDTATGLSGVIEGSYLAGRSDYSQYQISGTLLYGFDLVSDDGQTIGVIKPFVTANVNEYGNQRIRAGLGFDTGALITELALSHMMTVFDEDTDFDTRASSVSLTMSLPF